MSLGFFPSVKNEARRVIQRLYIGIGFSTRYEEMGILILFSSHLMVLCVFCLWFKIRFHLALA
jgi:hypothetical protein